MQEKRKIKLDDLEKKQVFSVPDSFFEELPGQISHKVEQGQRSLPLFELPVFRYGAALASICLIILIGYFMYKPSVTGEVQPEAILSQVSDQEIVLYLQQAEISQYELVETASEANIVIEENALEEIEINRELLLEETNSELIEELI
ncbi:hypothetical protein GXP67_29350 [Rhodocytophaga rosea]|uniref:Uncharacterized protein n=1 Tax=Rhodocytophaga rosea TaxID=2704465 RepID=A0A6C0GQX2_9BACT|nr:hypothetical protein [Rhodocytophaga rosea]QHT70466.1 hypothetical protein GXP67_29350 [Rhodocytophaga rosea]